MPRVMANDDPFFKGTDIRLIMNQVMDYKYPYDNDNSCWIHEPITHKKKDIKGRYKNKNANKSVTHCLQVARPKIVQLSNNTKRIYAYAYSVSNKKYQYQPTELGKIVFLVLEKQSHNQWKLLHDGYYDGPLANCCILSFDVKRINSQGDYSFVFIINDVLSGRILSSFIILLPTKDGLLKIAHINRTTLSNQQKESHVEILEQESEDDFYPILVTKTNSLGKVIETKIWRYNQQNFIYEEPSTIK